MIRLVSWLSSVVLLAGCSTAPPWETGSLEVDGTNCAGGLQWQSADPDTYLALTCESDQVFVWLSFEPTLADAPASGWTPDVLEEHFDYVNLILYDASKTTKRRWVYWTNLEPIREIAFDGVDGRLQWSMDVLVDVVTTEREPLIPSLSCRTGDVAGSCYSDEEVDRDVDLSFDLAFPELTAEVVDALRSGS